MPKPMEGAGVYRRAVGRWGVPCVKVSALSLDPIVFRGYNSLPLRLQNLRVVESPANGHSTDALWTNRNFTIYCPVCSEVAGRPLR